VLAVSGLDFDLSVYDVFGLLGAGGALVLPREEERREARRLVELVLARGVTCGTRCRRCWRCCWWRRGSGSCRA